MINAGDVRINTAGDIILDNGSLYYTNAVFGNSTKECGELVSELKNNVDIEVHPNKCNFYIITHEEVFYFNFDGIFFYIHPFEIRNYPKDSDLNTILNNFQVSTYEKSLYLKNMDMLLFNNGLAYFKFRDLLKFSF